MKRRIELTDVEFTRLALVFGAALGGLPKEHTPLLATQVAELYERIERESELVSDDATDN